jgi:antitoxin component HigA of HigAB toxin-antitoxin module
MPRKGRGKDFERLVAQETLILEATEEVCRAMEASEDCYPSEAVTRKELAKRLGCGKSHVTQLLSGERNLTLRTVADLAGALGHKATITLEPIPEPPGETNSAPSTQEVAG